MQHKVVFLDRESVGADVRKFGFDHHYEEHEATETHEIVERLKGATVAVINKVPMRAETLAAAARLEAHRGRRDRHGRDRQGPPPRSAGITVVNIRNYAFNTVPEHVIALMFALKRKIVELPHRRAERRVEQLAAVLLLRSRHQRRRGIDHRHRRLRRHRQVDRQALRGARHEGHRLRRDAPGGQPSTSRRFCATATSSPCTHR